MDIVFTINGTDYSGLLSTYSVAYEYEYPEVLKTMDGTEHYGKVYKRPSISFSLLPLTDAQCAAFYALILGTNTVSYTDPEQGQTMTAYMRFTSNVEHTFGLRSVDGNRYYKGGTMTLRQLSTV